MHEQCSSDWLCQVDAKSCKDRLVGGYSPVGVSCENGNEFV